MYSIVLLFFVFSCHENSNANKKKYNHFTELQKDSVNVVKLGDSLVIFEGTCRGCEYEESTTFEIEDPEGLMVLERVETVDYSHSNVDGGSISKTLILTSQKTGNTQLKVFKFYDPDDEELKSKDALHFVSYKIKVIE